MHPAASLSGLGVLSATEAVSFTTAAGLTGTGVLTAAAVVTGAGGAQIDASLLGGTVTQIPWGGTATPALWGGTVTSAQWGGTVTAAAWAGTITGGPVVVQIDQTAVVNNDSVYAVQVTYNGSPLNLTGYTLKAYLKASRLTPDSEAVLFQSGSGITITSAALGELNLDIPHADLPSPTFQWYRIDVIDSSGNITTAIYGNLSVLPA